MMTIVGFLHIILLYSRSASQSHLIGFVSDEGAASPYAGQIIPFIADAFSILVLLFFLTLQRVFIESIASSGIKG